MTRDDNDGGPEKIDVYKMIQTVLDRSILKIENLLNPDDILDLFTEKNLFGDTTRMRVRDIQEAKNTSAKNKEIYESVRRNPTHYPEFKECLAATRQTNLLDILEKREEGPHTAMIEDGYHCVCQAAGTCEMLASLKCNREIPEYVPSTIRDSQNRLLSDVQKKLISLYNMQCQKVPLYLLSPEDREHVKNLYVHPTMIEMNPSGERVLNNKASSTKPEVKLKDTRDLFFSDDKSYRNIYIVAESGSGKSTLCEFLVYLWVKEHSALNRKGKQSEDESFMESFDLLFYISLRDANIQSTWNVEAMIKDQLELENMDVSKLLFECECLIILDGLDEYSLKHKGNARFINEKLPYRVNSDKLTILTTSRPWKMEMLAGEPGVQIDRQIRITGLELNSQYNLAKNVISLLQVNSKSEQNKDFNDFIHDMNTQQLNKYMKTPILLLQMLGLWIDGESFGTSQCEIYSKMIEKQIQFAAEVKKIPIASNMKEIHGDEKEQTEIGLLHKLSKFVPRYLFGKNHAPLPTCFDCLNYCQTYQGLLLKLSKLAYHLLFGNQNSVLVFDHDQMEINGLSEEEIQSCLHLGLLTQYKVLGKITRKKEKSISFVHKSHQEFFAAIHMWQTSDLKHLLDNFTVLDRALQIEKVLTFVSGMNPDVSREISKVIMGLRSSDDPKIQQYQESCLLDAPQTSMVKHIQGIILTAIEESRRKGRRTPFLPRDIWMEGEDQDFPPSRILSCSQSLQLFHVRSICISKPSSRKECEELWRLVKNAAQQLHKLVLSNCDINVSVLQEIAKNNNHSLRVIGIYSVFNFSLLDEVTVLWVVSANSIALCSLELTYEQVQLVYTHLGRRPRTQVVLSNLHCNLHGKNCELRLDLSTSRQLHTLTLASLPVQDVVFIPDNLKHCEIRNLSANVATSVIRSLRGAHSLELFECYCDMEEDAAVSQELMRTLPHLDTLKYITLDYIDMTCAQRHVFPNYMKALEAMLLFNVKLRETQLGQLFAALPSHGVEVVLDNVMIADYNGTCGNLVQMRDSPNTKGLSPLYSRTYNGDKSCCFVDFSFYHKKIK